MTYKIEVALKKAVRTLGSAQLFRALVCFSFFPPQCFFFFVQMIDLYFYEC